MVVARPRRLALGRSQPEPRFIAALLIAACLAAPARSRAQPDLEGLPVQRVEILARDIYDPAPHGRLAAFYRLANRLHARTRTSTVRAHLLFAPGTPWSEARAEETLRNLRELNFLDPRSIVARREGDSVVVAVVTRDAWTTSPEFNIESTGGQRYGSFAFTERNLLGLGQSVSISYNDDPTGISRRFSFSDPSVLGSRLRVDAGAGTGSAGATHRLYAGVPFYAEDARHSYFVRWSRETSVARLFQRASETASLDRRVEETQVARGVGMRRGDRVLRLVGSFLVHDRRLGPSRVQATTPEEFDGGEENLRLRRLSGTVSVWRPRFIQREGIEKIGVVEDFDVGHAVATTFGFSPEFLGGTADEGYVRLDAHAGVETPAGFGLLSGMIQSRIRSRPVEVMRDLHARWVSPVTRDGVLVLAARGAWQSRVPRDGQLVVGGLTGLRAYPVQALAGRQLWRLNAENRWTLRRDLLDLASLGAAAFYDAARAWGPGAEGTSWFESAGVGLRVALPHSALNQVVRFDFAWPLSPSSDGHRAMVLSFGSSQAF